MSRQQANPKKSLCSSLQYLPPQLLSLSLGVIVLGHTWHVAEVVSLIPEGSVLVFRVICDCLAFSAVFLYLCKLSFYFSSVYFDAIHPHKSPSLSAGCMTMMFLGKEIALLVNLPAGEVIWFVAVGVYLVCFGIFIYYRIREFITYRTPIEGAINQDRSVKNFLIMSVYPGWIVPAVGILIASITWQPFTDNETYSKLVGHACLFEGIAMLFIIGPLVEWRVLFGPRLHDNLVGSLGIQLTPPILSYTAWELNFEPDADDSDLFGAVLLVFTGLSVLTFLWFSPLVFKTWWRHPNISFVGMTFPSCAVVGGVLRVYRTWGKGSTTMMVFCWCMLVAATVCVTVIFSWFMKAMLFDNLLSAEMYHSDEGVPESYIRERERKERRSRVATSDGRKRESAAATSDEKKSLLGGFDTSDQEKFA